MAWTDPKTFLAGALVAAAELNTYLRDNLRLLKTAISDRGQINCQAATELTIAAGAITVTRNLHTLDTEDDAASDDFDTITAGTAVAAGFLLTVLVEDTDRAITLKDGTGNLALGRDIVLHSANQMAVLVYDGTSWRAVTMAGGIKRIQRGYATYTFPDADPVGTTHDVTIPYAVTLAKAAFFYTRRGDDSPTPDLVSSQTIRITKRGEGGGNNKMAFTWQIVEFY